MFTVHNRESFYVTEWWGDSCPFARRNTYLPPYSGVLSSSEKLSLSSLLRTPAMALPLWNKNRSTFKFIPLTVNISEYAVGFLRLCFFYFDLFYLLIVGVKCCYCSWLQSVTPTRTHTHSLENPVRGIGPLRRPLPVKHTNSEDTNSHAQTWSESAFQARTWRHTYALDRGATGIGIETKCSY